jgi:hypothetical protein
MHRPPSRYSTEFAQAKTMRYRFRWGKKFGETLFFFGAKRGMEAVSDLSFIYKILCLHMLFNLH